MIEDEGTKCTKHTNNHPPESPQATEFFGPFSEQKGIFPGKWHQHVKCLMLFYLYAKHYKKWLNGSKVIANWEIEWSDWLRAFMTKY